MSNGCELEITSRLRGVYSCERGGRGVRKFRFFEFFLCFPGDVVIEHLRANAVFLRDAPLIGLASDLVEAIRMVDESGYAEVVDLYGEYRITLRAQGSCDVQCEFDSDVFVVSFDCLKGAVSRWIEVVFHGIEEFDPGVLNSEEYMKVKKYFSHSAVVLLEGARHGRSPTRVVE